MIRSYDPNDEDALIAVWLASTIPGQSFLPEEHWRAMEPEIRELLSLTETWVAEHSGEIVAFISLLDNMIGGLFTHPDHQGKGYGRALIEQARGGHDRLLVEVFEANIPAVGFYQSCGFAAYQRKIDEGSGLSLLILGAG